jgi:hypothetical protein
VNYFRKFIPNAADRAQRLFELRDKEFRWTPELETVYCDLYEALVQNAYLHFPKPGIPFELAVDASDTGIAGALFQTFNGERRYLGFHSRKLHDYERNYTMPKKELLSVVYHVTYYRDYLIDTKFRLWTDNKAVTLAFNHPHHAKRDRTMMNWMTVLNEYSFDILHIPGEENTLPDLGSRIYSIESAPTQETLTDDQITEVLAEAHALGHFGANVMARHIQVTREITNIPNLQERCLKYTQQCSVCRRMNTQRISFAPLREPTSRTPNERWHADLLFMTTTVQGNRYVLTVVDELTHFT